MATLSFQCTIKRLQGASFLVLSELAWHWADLTYTFRADGLPAREEDLEVGNSAIASVLNGTVQKVVLVDHPASLLFTDGVIVYSVKVFPVSSLFNMYSFSKAAIATLRLIECRCVGVRKCNAGGEMGFWQAFAVAFVEHLGRKSTPISALRRAIQCVEETGEGELVRTLKDLERHKAERNGGMEWVNKMSKEEAFWRRLAEVWREYSIRYLGSLGDKVDFLDIDAATAQLLLNEEPLNEIGIKLMAKAFSLKITIYSPQLDHFKHSYEIEEPSSEISALYLFRDNAAFHILYSSAQLEVENYSIDTMKIVRNEQQLLDVSRLSHEQKSRVQMKSTIELDFVQIQRRVEKLTKFASRAQRFTHAVCAKLEDRKLDDFYSHDLFNTGLLMVQESNSSIGRLVGLAHNTDVDFVLKTVASLQSIHEESQLIQNHFLSHKNLCEHCQVEIGTVVLDCAHIFCINDIGRYISESLSNDPLIFQPNGDTTEDLRCMKLTCYTQISGRKLREIIGEDNFNNWIQYVEGMTQTKCCWRCAKIREITYFQQACSCGQQLCAFCVCDLYRRNHGYCICGQLFPDETIQSIKKAKSVCSVCFIKKPILHDFSYVECKDHIVCHDCLSNSTRHHKRCRQCYRYFTTQEFNDLMKIIEKICLFCGSECSGNRLLTDCGCVICLKCAKTGVIRTKDCSTCFACNESLSETGHAQLFQIRQEESMSMYICTVCNEQIGAQTSLILPCGHIFHAECLSDHVDYLLKSDFSEEQIPCPMFKCGVLTSVKDLEHFLSPGTFKQLYENMIRWRSSPCPQCKNLVLDRDENDSKKSSVVCPNCRFHFCVICSGEYRQGHSQVLCKFNLIQARVRIAEESALEGEVVIQCPGCKNPFLYTGGCPDAKCISHGCGMTFCVWCAVPACQYKTHGDAWHRPNCKLFKKVNPKTGMSSDCQICLSLGYICPPPLALRTPQRFSLEES